MRGKRRMPSVQAIHEYWCLERPDDAWQWFGQGDVGEPSCYACGYWHELGRLPKEAEEWTWKGWQRAHVIDRCRGGLDGVQNLTLLCRECHRIMQSYGPGDEEAALAWYANPDYRLLRFMQSLTARLKGVQQVPNDYVRADVVREPAKTKEVLELEAAMVELARNNPGDPKLGSKLEKMHNERQRLIESLPEAVPRLLAGSCMSRSIPR